MIFEKEKLIHKMHLENHAQLRVFVHYRYGKLCLRRTRSGLWWCLLQLLKVEQSNPCGFCHSVPYHRPYWLPGFPALSGSENTHWMDVIKIYQGEHRKHWVLCAFPPRRARADERNSVVHFSPTAEPGSSSSLSSKHASGSHLATVNRRNACLSASREPIRAVVSCKSWRSLYFFLPEFSGWTAVTNMPRSLQQGPWPF